MLLRNLRRYSTTSRLTKEEVKALLKSTHWSIESLTASNQTGTDAIKPKTLSKMLKLSGFQESVSKEREQVLINSLRTQMGFINHLYDNQSDALAQTDEPLHSFRLLVSDHQPGSPLTLNDIKDQIKNQVPDSTKGETQEWGATHNSKSNIEGSKIDDEYFTVKPFSNEETK
ncbi:glutamyl-tRNA(Gln) amidotransferase subunit F, mitochondrial [[Candida] railenensis]|uniref:Glutamyl-tRNA(Gln) amidotransferase subunit F, mitochondrial n=1 Tax=[Candida] railenensis TaxID=45579 RepID=A0A9P0QQE1_9ASCO|nr:glutamyl-tRNA(Gln) amidotransferase subunit F, mitochondrial [[Candida] railenensis]